MATEKEVEFNSLFNSLTHQMFGHQHSIVMCEIKYLTFISFNKERLPSFETIM